jgi:hypothetical protein
VSAAFVAVKDARSVAARPRRSQCPDRILFRLEANAGVRESKWFSCGVFFGTHGVATLAKVDARKTLDPGSILDSRG